MKNLLIVDGHHLLFKMFFGMPSRIIGKNGKPIHAIIGFLGALLKVINATKPSEIIAVFDSEEGSNRTDIDSDYKANRIDYTEVVEEDNPFSQLDDIYKVLDNINIRHFESKQGFEADDHIMGYVNQYKDTHNVYILSGDSDFFQLVSENVFLYIYRGKSSIVYDTTKVYERYGVYPKYFADYKCLVGDKSDNIKGIKMVGEKTAKSLIDSFGHVEDILKNVELIKSQTIRNNIKEDRKRLLDNVKLIRLSREIDNPYSQSEIKWESKELKTMQVLKELDYI